MRIDRVTVDLGQGEIAAGVTFVARSLVKPFDSLRVLAFDSDRYKRIENSKYDNARLSSSAVEMLRGHWQKPGKTASNCSALIKCCWFVHCSEESITTTVYLHEVLIPICYKNKRTE